MYLQPSAKAAYKNKNHRMNVISLRIPKMNRKIENSLCLRNTAALEGKTLH